MRSAGSRAVAVWSAPPLLPESIFVTATNLSLEIVSAVGQSARLLVLRTGSEKDLRLRRIDVPLDGGAGGKSCLDGARYLRYGRQSGGDCDYE